MSISICTGRRGVLPDALAKEASRITKVDENQTVFVIVPNQLTLDTEILLFDALGIKGSFSLNIVSPRRFCEYVFEECGHPSGKPIDEQGRAMLMGYLLRKHAKQLTRFASASRRTGFEQKLVNEIARIKQAGIRPDDLQYIADKQTDGSLKGKLLDLSVLYRAYEDKLAGLLQDGEDAIEAAISLMQTSAALKNACILIYGFDITTAQINRLIAGTASVCRDVTVYLPLPDEERRDVSIYLPMERSLERLIELLTDKHIPFTRVKLPDADIKTPLKRLTSELYCMPRRACEYPEGALKLAALKNPYEEAEYTAAGIRELVRERSWHYSDICVVTDSPETYLDVIDRAFAEFEIPYFTQEIRNAASQPLCAFIIDTLTLISGRARSCLSLCETGFTALDETETETLMSYCTRMKLRPGALLRPFTRGTAEMLATNEPLREKLAAPVNELKSALREAKTLKEQLCALYDYLVELDCFTKCALRRRALIASGESLLAADDARVVNMLMSVFEQMIELFGDSPLSAVMLSDLIKRAMNAAIMKLLPQSPDSVNICSPQRLGTRPVKAMFMLHCVASDDSAEGGVLDSEEINLLSDISGRYLAPDRIALARTKRMYAKDALGLAEEYVSVSYPISDTDGSAFEHGSIISEIRRLLPQNGNEDEHDAADEMDRLRFTAQKSALNSIMPYISAGKSDAYSITALKLLEASGEAAVLRRAAKFRALSEPIDILLARSLYKRRASISRLEEYALCPFRHFVHYGLKPQSDEPFEVNPQNRGQFLHECAERFTKTVSGIQPDAEEYRARMNEVVDEVLQGELSPYIKDGNSAQMEVASLRRIASRAAEMLYKQLKKGIFAPIELEVDFGKEGRQFINLPDGTAVPLDGRIDRVDGGIFEGEKYTFVVDYKSGSKQLDASEIYAGLELQLLVYLAASCRKHSALCAGIYYFHIADKPVASEERETAAIEKERVKSTKLKGISLADERVLNAIADDVSSVIDVSFTQGGISKKANVATQEEFRLLMNHVMSKCAEFTRRIYAGDTAVRPIKTRSGDACRYCRYSAICMKDKHLGPSKRRLEKLKFTALKEKLLNEQKDLKVLL
ncbi:MAG: PD-(D/E)XK nuclease family protein [Clostridia bacterium]|nr:PD-(D/E)XK nuclease family protein [Clostridia bacterium]